MGRQLILCVLALASATACQRAEPAKRYQLQGQILAVRAATQELTIKHGDIVGLMPGMTMTFGVARPELLTGRAAGEIITATLEVTASTGRLVDIVHVGEAPLPSGSEVAMASGLLESGDAVPDAPFVDQTGRHRAFAEWRGRPTVLTFIYTQCPLPNFCPLMDQNFATLQRLMADEARLAGKVALVSVSFDPDHDTPEVLNAHAARVKANPAVWTFLTADRAVVDEFAGRFGVGVLRDPAAAGQITHNLRTAVIGADGKIVKIYSGSDWTPGQVLADLRSIVK